MIFRLIILLLLLFISRLPAQTEFFIDYRDGNDSNPGTREKPWKHHPWDTSGSVKTVIPGDNVKFIFRRGIIYRGSISTLKTAPGASYEFSSAENWGAGDAFIYGSESAGRVWKNCSGLKCQIPEAGKSSVWYIELPDGSIPMMLYEKRKNEIIRIDMARSPNWKVRDQNNPRSEWNEFTGSCLLYAIELDNTDGFQTGDLVSGSGKWIDKEEDLLNTEKGLNRITEINGQTLIVGIESEKKGEFAKGAVLRSANASGTIISVSFTGSMRLRDEINFKQQEREYWQGGLLWWSEPALRSGVISDYDPHKNEVYTMMSRSIGDKKYIQYFVEGLPQLLDSENEWCFIREGEHRGKLFVRLRNNQNPNETEIEIPRREIFLSGRNTSGITVKKLAFYFFNNADLWSEGKAMNPTYYSSVIRFSGSSSNINIENCSFRHVSQAISFFPDQQGQSIDFIKIISNDFTDLDSGAICMDRTEQMWALRTEKIIMPDAVRSRINHIAVSYNNISNCAFRELNHNRNGAVNIRGCSMAVIDHNNINYTDGVGIFIRTGEYYKGGSHIYEMDYPCNRVLIFSNTVINTMYGSQDYGGIASWFGGPAYIFNNISGNAVGIKNAEKKLFPGKTDWYRTGCWAPALYLDQGYKQYVFNNILWGINNNENDKIYNAAGINEAEGFMNIFFNNTIYNCALGFHKGMGMHNRCYYLNNLFLKIGERYFSHEVGKNLEFESLAFSGNVFAGHDRKDFAKFGNTDDFSSLADLKIFLDSKKALASDCGVETPAAQVIDAQKHDFRLQKDSICIDQSKKVFVPWGLYMTIGEWGFYRNPSDLSLVYDEHINWNNEWKSREAVRKKGTISRRDLSLVNCSDESFREGFCENWIRGALALDGRNQYCQIPGRSCGLLDMSDNCFLIEAVVMIPASARNGVLVSKEDSSSGYRLFLESGILKIQIKASGSSKVQSSETALNTGKWTHIIAEIDRPSGKINFYINGKPAEPGSNVLVKNENLSNPADFFIGCANQKEFLECTLDFLRISRGTLAMAETSIRELYNWQFNGPFLRDFNGHRNGGSRDVGAIDYTDSN